MMAGQQQGMTAPENPTGLLEPRGICQVAARAPPADFRPFPVHCTWIWGRPCQKQQVGMGLSCHFQKPCHTLVSSIQELCRSLTIQGPAVATGRLVDSLLRNHAMTMSRLVVQVTPARSIRTSERDCSCYPVIQDWFRPRPDLKRVKSSLLSQKSRHMARGVVCICLKGLARLPQGFRGNAGQPVGQTA